MKKVLVNKQGYVMQIEEPGDDFEIYEGPDAAFVWVDAPDDITLQWTLEHSPAQGKMVWVDRENPPVDKEMQRKVAYGEVGAQLDMLYHDIQDGNLENGSWVNHISAVKATFEAPDSVDDELSPEEELALEAVREPSVDKKMKMSDDAKPSWIDYPGWKGYTGDKEVDL